MVRTLSIVSLGMKNASLAQCHQIMGTKPVRKGSHVCLEAPRGARDWTKPILLQMFKDPMKKNSSKHVLPCQVPFPKTQSRNKAG